MSCPACKSAALETRFRWTEPPNGETRFELPAATSYEREFLQCAVCGHLVARLEFDVKAIYASEYVDATYADGLEEVYERIMSLPPGSSDNVQRVERVCDELGRGDSAGELLDVGSGLCVFGARMAEQGWGVTAVDPDSRAVAHARDRVGVAGVEGDFMELGSLGAFPLISFNKVLEHVEDPIEMLARARIHLAEGGTVYIEVPDGEAAAAAGGEQREELFVEHLHAFSAASLALVAQRAGFRVLRLDRLHEPSDKYTLAAFLR